MRLGYESFLGVAKETAWGTEFTATNFLEFTSENFIKTQEGKVLEAIGGTGRNPVKRYLHYVTVNGTVECPLNIFEDAVCLMLNNGMGGTITSSGTPSDGYAHVLTQGDMASGTTALTFTKRIGDSTDLFRYSGCRVNSLSIKGEVGTPEIMLSVELIGKDGTITTDSHTVAISANTPLLWSGVTYEEADTTTSFDLSTTAKEITAFELTYNNNLLGDDNSRALGSNFLSVLPVGKATAAIKVTQRYDSSTAYTIARDLTEKSIRFTLDSGQTLGSEGATTGGLVITFPKCHLEYDGSQPENGSVELIMQELSWTPLQPTTAQDFINLEYYNNTASY